MRAWQAHQVNHLRESHIHTYIHIHTPTNHIISESHTHTYIHIHIHTALSSLNASSASLPSTSSQRFTHTYIHTQTHTVFSSLKVSLASQALHAYVNTYMHIHTPTKHIISAIHTHTHIHTYIHTYINKYNSSLVSQCELGKPTKHIISESSIAAAASSSSSNTSSLSSSALGALKDAAKRPLTAPAQNADKKRRVWTGWKTSKNYTHTWVVNALASHFRCQLCRCIDVKMVKTYTHTWMIPW